MGALSFAQALSLGFEPREYGTDVPVGEITARFDFKMWGKSVNLRCFFTNAETGKKFSLSAYRSHRSEHHYTRRDSGNDCSAYTPEDQSIDFASGDYDGKIFRLVTRQGTRGGVLWLSAEILPGHAAAEV